MSGQGSVMAVLMGSLNDILEKYLLVPFQVCFSSGPTGISSLVPASSSSWREHAHLPVGTQGCSASCCSKPWLPTAISHLQVCIPHSTHHSTCFAGANGTPSHLLYQLLLLLPLIVTTITPAANEFTHTHTEYLQGGNSSWSHNTSCALLLMKRVHFPPPPERASWVYTIPFLVSPLSTEEVKFDSCSSRDFPSPV